MRSAKENKKKNTNPAISWQKHTVSHPISQNVWSISTCQPLAATVVVVLLLLLLLLLLLSMVVVVVMEASTPVVRFSYSLAQVSSFPTHDNRFRSRKRVIYIARLRQGQEANVQSRFKSTILQSHTSAASVLAHTPVRIRYYENYYECFGCNLYDSRYRIC